MNRETFTKWFGGPLVHAHLHQEGKIVNPDVELHQFTQIGAVNYLTRLTGRSSILITDTNHAMIDIYRHRDDWLQLSNESDLAYSQRKIDYSSGDVLRRCQESRPITGILTGVETDILNERGEVSTSTEVMEKLDIVIASLHWRTWKKFTGSDEISMDTKAKILSAYSRLSDNPHIDILGHPTVFPDELKALFRGEELRPVLEKMKSRNMAMEVNISVDLTLPEFGLERELMIVAGQIGVPIAIGSDVHHLNDYGLQGVFPDYITQANWSQAFDYHGTSGCHFSLFRFMARNIRLLESSGINPNNVINSSYENFAAWSTRRSL
jgi:histidinol phosphatase-like PHP family hydrolase